MVHAVANAFIERNVMENMITLQTCFCHVMRATLTISVKTDYEVSVPRFGAPAVKVRCGILSNRMHHQTTSQIGADSAVRKERVRGGESFHSSLEIVLLEHLVGQCLP